MIGYYRANQSVGVTEPERPDSRYGVSKAFGEALGRMYADKYGLEVACLRIGSFRAKPQDARQLATWISHRDMVALTRCCIEAPAFHFLVLYGVSNNTRNRWQNPHAAKIGYRPLDNAEQYAAELEVEKAAGRRPRGGFSRRRILRTRIRRRQPPHRVMRRKLIAKEMSMQENRAKRIVREGGMALGTYVGGIADPQIVEIIGHAGFDAAFIDLEHTSFDLRDVQLMVMAAERVGITPVVRTPGFDPAFILRLLDMGVQGIQLPHVNDAETARAAVRAVRYAPLGERGMASGTRASDFGKVPPQEHMAQSNREIMLAIMIEELSALDEIEEIASTEGIDLVVVGPADMSRALGVSGQTNHPKLVETIARVAEVVRKSGVTRLALPMNNAVFPRDAAELRKLGVGYANCAPSPEVRLLRRFAGADDRSTPLARGLIDEAAVGTCLDGVRRAGTARARPGVSGQSDQDSRRFFRRHRDRYHGAHHRREAQ